MPRCSLPCRYGCIRPRSHEFRTEIVVDSHAPQPRIPTGIEVPGMPSAEIRHAGRSRRRLRLGIRRGGARSLSEGTGGTGLPRTRPWPLRKRCRGLCLCPTRASVARVDGRTSGSHMVQPRIRGAAKVHGAERFGGRCPGMVRSVRRNQCRQITGFRSESRLHHLRNVRTVSESR